MKVLALLLALSCSLSLYAEIISSVERLDAPTPPDSLVHSLQPMFPVWNDYTFHFRAFPSYLLGADQIRTYYFADSVDPDFRLRITLAVPATVFLMIDDRTPDVATTMPWVSALGFADSGDEAVIQVSEDLVLTTASIYSGNFPAGDLVLYQQNDVLGNSGMFTVAAVPEPESLLLLLLGIAFRFCHRCLCRNARNC